MKKFLLILFLHSFALIGFSQNLEIPITQKECTEQIISHLGFTVSYNQDWLIPNWVAYELTNTEVNGTYPRRGSFCPDPKVKGRTAVTYDYTNSGYDRGHMAPAADLKWSEQSMLESFYLSNICPQNRNLNSGIWLGLEEAVRLCGEPAVQSCQAILDFNNEKVIIDSDAFLLRSRCTCKNHSAPSHWGQNGSAAAG